MASELARIAPAGAMQAPWNWSRIGCADVGRNSFAKAAIEAMASGVAGIAGPMGAPKW